MTYRRIVATLTMAWWGCLVTACRTPTAVVCPADLVANVVVQVRDSVTGAAQAIGATGDVSSGSYASALFAVDSLVMLERRETEEHAGQFVVRVSKSGYREWISSDVVVTSGSCHIKTDTVRARLVPSSQ